MPNSENSRTTMSRTEIGEMRRAKMRNRLIAAGAKVIAERGSQKATIDDFITEAEVSRGTFYNHFSTREQMLEAIWTSRGHDPFEAILTACRSISNPAEHLSAVTRLVLQEAMRDPTLGWLIIALSADVSTVNEDLREYPLPDLVAGQAAGVFHFDDLACAADMVVGTVRAGLHVLLSETRESHYIDSMSKLLLIALGVVRADAHRISHSALPIPDAIKDLA
ncbi:MAG: TetR/AcrR family transcriptional regulator [Sphingobium sp.]|nr:TetR/AcrR family transcriptional regulator [Sphingobium sp.]MCP5400041.1 TetR/AcrR family transcriptional regulator [Sphingomonas sp.]